MLVDLPEGWDTNSAMARRLAEHGHEMWTHERVAQGVYGDSWAVEEILEEEGLLVTSHPFEPWWDAHGAGPHERMTMLREALERGDPYDYGVCDDWEQILEKWPTIRDSERQFVITLIEIRREDQPERDGWRWHKWGAYIGNKSQHYEYLYDEPEVERVFCYQILEVKV